MKASLLRSVLLSASLVANHAFTAEESPAAKPVEPAAPKQQASEEAIRARLMEHTRIKAAARSATPASSAASGTTAPAPAKSAPTSTAEEKAAAAAATEKAKSDPAAVLPKVEVTKPRITVLDHQLALQEKEIAREKKLTKSSDLDQALNGTKVSVPIFGGESTKYRTAVASERVSLMESEKDIIEAIAHARTKEEKAELKKELNELKALRRDLERSLR